MICPARFLALDLDSGELFEQFDGSGDVLVSMAPRYAGGEHLVYQSGTGQRHTQFPSRIQHQADIFLHPLQGECRLEVALEDLRSLEADQTGLSRAVIEEASRMSTTWWLVLAVTWSGIGTVVALFLGRILRDVSPVPEQ